MVPVFSIACPSKIQLFSSQLQVCSMSVYYGNVLHRAVEGYVGHLSTQPCVTWPQAPWHVVHAVLLKSTSLLFYFLFPLCRRILLLTS